MMQDASCKKHVRLMGHLTKANLKSSRLLVLLMGHPTKANLKSSRLLPIRQMSNTMKKV